MLQPHVGARRCSGSILHDGLVIPILTCHQHRPPFQSLPTISRRCRSTLETQKFLQRKINSINENPWTEGRDEVRTRALDRLNRLRGGDGKGRAAKNRGDRDGGDRRDSDLERRSANDDDGRDSNRRPTKWYEGEVQSRGRDSHTGGRAKSRNAWDLLKEQKEDASDAPKGVAAGVRGHIERELVWLKDPVQLTRRTQALLAKGEIAKALELVRVASRSRQCTICWNALIDSMLGKGQVNAALQVFNEMKKRAQFPDSYTYTILFRGLARNVHVSSVVPRAIALYFSMTGPGSRVQPGIVHSNAALQVCARAEDMTALWSIVNQIPESGPNAADKVTFTTIFQAMKADIERTDRQTDADLVTGSNVTRNATIIQARQLWAEIIKRWQKGDWILDELLVSAMGKLLLMGRRPQDWDDIFSLAQQTMGIRRCTAPIRRDIDAQAFEEGGSDFPIFLGQTELQASPELDDDAGGEFAPLPITPSMKSPEELRNHATGLSYVAINQDLLSLILTACEKLRLKQAATSYWITITHHSGYAVEPDLANCHAYLRVLRRAKASSEAVAFVRDQMRQVPQTHNAYRIAMSTCVRNKLSPKAMSDASELMDLMSNRRGKLDIKVCSMWMDLGLSSSDRKDTVRALERLGPQMINLTQIAKVGDNETKEDVVKVMRSMISAIRRLLDENFGPKQQRSELEQRMQKLHSYVVRYDDARQELSKEGVIALRKVKELESHAEVNKSIKTRDKKAKADRLHSTASDSDASNESKSTLRLRSSSVGTMASLHEVAEADVLNMAFASIRSRNRMEQATREMEEEKRENEMNQNTPPLIRRYQSASDMASDFAADGSEMATTRRMSQKERRMISSRRAGSVVQSTAGNYAVDPTDDSRHTHFAVSGEVESGTFSQEPMTASRHDAARPLVRYGSEAVRRRLKPGANPSQVDGAYDYIAEMLRKASRPPTIRYHMMRDGPLSGHNVAVKR